MDPQKDRVYGCYEEDKELGPVSLSAPFIVLDDGKAMMGEVRIEDIRPPEE